MLIQKHNTNWKTNFESIKEVLMEANQNVVIKVEHIGSTAVSGLSAKPIIDIDLIYASEDDFFEIKQNLESLGYYHNGNQGIEGREVFKRFREGHFTLDSINHHLYVCHESSMELKRHLLFRDKLREDKKLAKEYEELKMTLALEANQDRKRYAELKEAEAKAFFERILKKEND